MNFATTYHRYITTNARSDTDSLIYHIECDNVYETMKHDVYETTPSYYTALSARRITKR